MTKAIITLRQAKLEDLEEIQKLFVDTISAVCKDDYSPKQIDVWTSSVHNKPRWIAKMNSHYFLIAGIDNKIVGCASLEGNNYLDLLYVHKDHQRQGIADELYTEIEKEAIERSAKILISDVSITAKAFFEKKGFIAVEKQINIINGVEIINYKMTKQLLMQ